MGIATVAETNIIEQAGDAGRELHSLASSLTQEQFNSIPFNNSWTTAQLVVHVTKSNKGIAQGMDMEGKTDLQQRASRVEELKKIFLDFTQKYKSPEFITPRPGQYEMNSTLAALQQSINQLQEKANKVNLSEVIEFPVFGAISKLELLYFVLYHTQRHLQQLRTIVKHLQA